MPIRNEQVKWETRVTKVCKGRLKETERSEAWQPQGTSEMLLQSPTSTVVSPEEGNCPRKGRRGGNTPQFIPVVSSSEKPLMPCHPARARELIRKGRAIRRFNKGVFYIKLLDRESGQVQDIACGVDPGSKQEAMTVKSEAHTFLNIQFAAVDWVSKAVEVRRNMRKARRYRNTPHRACRRNRACGGLAPSTRARWGWKLRIAKCLVKLYPISAFVVEDIKARTKGKRRWDSLFSPLEIGKTRFYKELGKLAEVQTKEGWETKEMRDAQGLEKTGNKKARVFGAHAVDSWVLANSWVGGHVKPDNKRLMYIEPTRLHRRQLHKLQPITGGIRRPYGGTRSLGFKRGSLVKHPKYGLVYVGGTMKDRISLLSLKDGKRLCQNARPSDCTFLAYNTWKTVLPRQLDAGS